MRDITSLEYREIFAATQQLPTAAIPTMLPTLNKLLRDEGGGEGLAPGWVCVIGANPGHAKTLIGLNLAASALSHGHPVGYVSLEMSTNQLASRYYAIQSGLPVASIERGSFNPRIWDKVEGSVAAMPPLYAPDKVSSRWEDVVRFVKETHDDHNVKFYVLDYIQLCAIGDLQSITDGISNVTTDLRAWAVNNDAVMVILSQFNRQSSSDYQTRPRSQSLLGGTILEASADVCALVNHAAFKREHSSNGTSRALTYLCIDKNRHGPAQVDIPIAISCAKLQVSAPLPDVLDEWPDPK